MPVTIVVPAEAAGELRETLAFHHSAWAEREPTARGEDADSLREVIEEVRFLIEQLGWETPAEEKDCKLRVEHPALLRSLVCGELESAIADLEDSDNAEGFEAIRRLRWGATVFEAMEEAA